MIIPGEEGWAKALACFSQDLLPLLEDAVLPTKPAQLLAFFGAQPFALSSIDLVLLDPSPERLGSHPGFLSTPLEIDLPGER